MSSRGIISLGVGHTHTHPLLDPRNSSTIVAAPAYFRRTQHGRMGETLLSAPGCSKISWGQNQIPAVVAAVGAVGSSCCSGGCCDRWWWVGGVLIDSFWWYFSGLVVEFWPATAMLLGFGHCWQETSNSGGAACLLPHHVLTDPKGKKSPYDTGMPIHQTLQWMGWLTYLRNHWCAGWFDEGPRFVDEQLYVT